MKIYLISGRQGAGKSTLARAIRQYHDLQFERIPTYSLRFAEIIYQMHDAIWAIMEAHGIKKPKTKDGVLLQLLGTEWGRKTIFDNVWVQCLLNKLRTLPPDSIVTVEDCRFENEFDAFTGVPGVITIRLEASQATRKARAEFWRENDTHPSETGLDHYAAMGRFNYTFNCDIYSTDEIVKALMK